MREFSIALFGKNADGEPIRDERVIRRFMNAAAPMQSDDFRRVIASAWLQRWISAMQAFSIHQNLLELESASSWLRRFLKRLRDRASFKNNGTITDDPETVGGELDAELRAVQEAFVESGRQKIARSTSISPEDKQWLLRQNRPTKDANIC